ncbi:MAG: hypothetical protein M1812_006586 [Candelaria pacifica]|nr:MAG: hypothetical protein M1812_006586 [Candelaria pacifica]
MADVKKLTVTEPYLKLECGLGEAPYWERDTNHLRFVDIVKKEIHEIDLSKGPASHTVIAKLDTPVGVTADIEGSTKELIIGAKAGYALFNRETGEYKYIKQFWDGQDDSGKEHRMRSNDGAVDSQGRFWVGTMNDDQFVSDPTAEGVLFRLDSDLSLHRMVSHCTIPNGIGWSADDKLMYWTDSPEKTIYVFDYEAASGSITNRRPFYVLEDKEGVPDGFEMDVEGHLWVACHGLGKVLRVSPEGKLVAEISFPTKMLSCPVLVGEDLFVTSGQAEEPDKYPESAKQAGSLFRVSVGVKGRPKYKFKYQG